MSVTEVFKDIQKYGAETLADLGLEAKIIIAEDPSYEDDSIEFFNGTGDRAVVHLSVSSLGSGGWKDSMLNVGIFEDKPLGGTGFVSREFAAMRHEDFAKLVRKGGQTCVERVLRVLQDEDPLFEPKDNFSEGVVTDLRFSALVEQLEEIARNYQGGAEIVFSHTDGKVDELALTVGKEKLIAVQLKEQDIVVTNAAEDRQFRVRGSISAAEVLAGLDLGPARGRAL